jgi:hypothetical protein
VVERKNKVKPLAGCSNPGHKGAQPPRTPKFFDRCRRYQDGLVSWCKACKVAHCNAKSRKAFFEHNDVWSRIAFSQYRRRAKDRRLSFDLTFEEFLNRVRKPCFYGGGVSTGLDRLDNSQGYTPENTVGCCGNCNMVKGQANTAETVLIMIAAGKTAGYKCGLQSSRRGGNEEREDRSTERGVVQTGNEGRMGQMFTREMEGSSKGQAGSKSVPLRIVQEDSDLQAD